MKKQSTESKQAEFDRPDPANINTSGKRKYPCLSTYNHRFDSMKTYAEFICLNKRSPRTQHDYYRQVRLLMDFHDDDPSLFDEAMVRDFYLHLVLDRKWKPRSLRVSVAALKAFYIDTLKNPEWKVFSQINTSDNRTKPNCPTLVEIVQLLGSLSKKRYKTPTKLVYCCGLRMSECLSLTIHDIKASTNQLIIHTSKGERDRVVPIASPMINELRQYWLFHENPLLIFPATGIGSQKPESLARRMGCATQPMNRSSFERAVRDAAKSINLKYATLQTLRHSFGTHYCQAGGNLLKLQQIMGHESIETTMIYLHLTHEIEASSLDLIEGMYQNLTN